MGLQVRELALQGVLVIECDVFEDDRGFFLEAYHRDKYQKQGTDRFFVQDNLSHSKRGVLRGLHYQLRHPQAKLVTVISGIIFDVAVDIRPGSETYGKWAAAELSAQGRQRQLFIPEGFAHGFCVLSDTADVLYKCTAFYDSADDRGIIWSDPTIAVQWPLNSPSLSTKDAALPRLNSLNAKDLPPI